MPLSNYDEGEKGIGGKEMDKGKKTEVGKAQLGEVLVVCWQGISC